jgi:hypothetical protein
LQQPGVPDAAHQDEHGDEEDEGMPVDPAQQGDPVRAEEQQRRGGDQRDHDQRKGELRCDEGQGDAQRDHEHQQSQREARQTGQSRIVDPCGQVHQGLAVDVAPKGQRRTT